MRGIGEDLRRRREARGITLEEAQAATKIRGRYLRALEEGEPQAIPGEVYVKGFLRAYADFLGLDGAAFVERYKAWRQEVEAQAQAAEPGPAPGTAVGAVAVPAGEGSGAEARGGSRPHAERRRQRRAGAEEGRQGLPAWVWAVAGGALILIAAVALRFGRPHGEAGPPPAGREAVSVPSAGGTAPSTGEASGGSTEAGGTGGGAGAGTGAAVSPAGAGGPEVLAPSAEPQVAVERTQVDNITYEFTVRGAADLRVTAAVTGNCWVRVVADGRVVEEATLRPGDSRTWTARDTLVVRAGFPPALGLTVNGRAVEPLPSEEPLWLNFKRAEGVPAPGR